MKKKIRIIVALAIGFIVGIIIMAIAIYFGYTKAYGTDVQALTVKLLGIPVYKLTRDGEVYAGETKGIFMGAFCGICMIVSLVVEIIISKIRKKKKGC